MIDWKEANSLGAGELARRAGVSTDTLRHYEAKGAIPRPPRLANGYRSYPPETLARVKLIRRALALGFTLDELTEILRVRDRGGAPCRRVRDLAAGKLEAVQERLQELIVLRDELRATLAEWDLRLASSPRDRRARLLEALDLPETLHPKRSAYFKTTATNNKTRKKS